MEKGIAKRAQYNGGKAEIHGKIGYDYQCAARCPCGKAVVFVIQCAYRGLETKSYNGIQKEHKRGLDKKTGREKPVKQESACKIHTKV
jgi:hypothetical protein